MAWIALRRPVMLPKSWLGLRSRSSWRVRKPFSLKAVESWPSPQNSSTMSKCRGQRCQSWASDHSQCGINAWGSCSEVEAALLSRLDGDLKGKSDESAAGLISICTYYTSALFITLLLNLYENEKAHLWRGMAVHRLRKSGSGLELGCQCGEPKIVLELHGKYTTPWFKSNNVWLSRPFGTVAVYHSWTREASLSQGRSKCVI